MASYEPVYKFNAGHEDLIHDIATDWYGKRIITCSSDQRIKIWDLDEATGAWVLNDSWKAHDSSILKVSWAHPEYGQCFASCSFDRTVKVWEECENEPKRSGKRWAERARLADSKGSVHDVEFAPNNVGLKLASVSADGMCRIYEAMDTMNLFSWTLMEEFAILQNPSSFPNRESDGHFCLSWCPNLYGFKSGDDQPMLAIGCGKENVARVFRVGSGAPAGDAGQGGSGAMVSKKREWGACEILGGHGDLVHDVSWAPNVGRSYHLIATACKDNHFRIFRLTPNANPVAGFVVECVADVDAHGSEVWRCEWNVSGTVVSSSGDDGRIRLWKANYLGEWKLLSIVGPDAPANGNVAQSVTGAPSVASHQPDAMET
ncbi:WD40-repeat-containing domain protein [Hyaloraphidium curvatum]|nr:WD40-repeat-containing domain protein [Hyaloraphidium curvatum]